MATAKRVAGLVASWSLKARAFSAAAQSPAQAVEPAARAASSVAAAAEAPRTIADLSDAQLVHLLRSGILSQHRLEADLADAARAVAVRRAFVADNLSRASASHRTSTNPHAAMAHLPSSAAGFDVDGFYKSILNTNCEAVLGYIPLPVGVVGPLHLDGKPYYVPMATTEGALVASTNRGCTAIRKAGGAKSVLLANGMTRAPLVRLSSLEEAARLKAWLEVPDNYAQVAAAFNSTTRFGRLQSITASTAGRNVYLRFKAFTGDAMGMNMITKGVHEALTLLAGKFPSMKVLSLSGNVCTDKKPSAINWIDGRGKSVAAEVRLSGHVLRTVLKTTADAMVDLNTSKNLVGSALAGSIGGFNAHASNIVTAVFLATGQDPAQNVESSTCLTLMEKVDDIHDPADPEGRAGPGIIMTVTMPSIEVGTVGGGTSLPAQAACLELLGLKGTAPGHAGANAEQLARVVAGAVLAGELSLMSALTTNDLLSAHLKLNRKPGAAPAHGHGHGAPAAAHHGAVPVTAVMTTKLRELLGHGSVAAAAAMPEGGHAAHASAAALAPSPSSLLTSYTTVYTAATEAPAATFTTAVGGAGTASAAASAASATSPAGSVPGGAPAGSHPHPLHLQAAVAPGAAAFHPGRRYFAAPTTRVSRFGGAHAGAASKAAAEAAAAALSSPAAWGGFQSATGVSAGVCEESRGVAAARNLGWEEPMLCVP